ncbi:DUF4202 family protein [Candidatus Parcubacteria bacterium]|nr:DUF4202 family protein [Candidatus Parcubacteria bacterium]
MSLELYQKAEQFVIESFIKANKARSIKHFTRAVYWVKQLKHDADEALLISAMAHDIERAFRKRDVIQIMQKGGFGFIDKNFLRLHEERGAEIIGNFLKEQNASHKIIDKVKMLVSRHEEGGNDEQNLLKDADSISFFENNIESFLTRKDAGTKKKSNTRKI